MTDWLLQVAWWFSRNRVSGKLGAVQYRRVLDTCRDVEWAIPYERDRREGTERRSTVASCRLGIAV
jgi:hypothetical protein